MTQKKFQGEKAHNHKENQNDWKQPHKDSKKLLKGDPTSIK